VQVRLLSQNKHELLRRVPDGLADVFRIGSTAPGQHPPLPKTVVGVCDMLGLRAITVLYPIAISLFKIFDTWPCSGLQGSWQSVEQRLYLKRYANHFKTCSAGALLYDARELFDQQNAKADEGLRSIVQSLPEAVATCVDAAQAELDEPRQIALMKVRPTPACILAVRMIIARHLLFDAHVT